MNLHHLAVFHAVAETGGVNRGAERLLVSQPAVSRQLRALEESLGLTLFERLPRGVRLTEAGAILADYARRLFALEKQAQTVLADVRFLRRGVLRLGGSMSLGNYLLPAVVAEFHRRHPAVEVSLEVANSDVIVNAVRESRVDIGFVEGAFEEDQFAFELLMHDELIVIARPDHPLAGRGPVLLPELCRHSCVMRESGSGTRSTLDQILASVGVDHAFNLTLGSPEAVKRAVQAGAGLAVVSYLTVISELEAGTLAHLPLAGAAMRRPLHRIMLPHKLPGPAAQPFLDLVRREANRYGSPPAGGPAGPAGRGASSPRAIRLRAARLPGSDRSAP